MSRFEKCCWYWSRFCELALVQLTNVSPERWMILDMSNVTIGDIEHCYQFAGLTGFQPEKIANMLAQRINSVREKTGGTENQIAFPPPEAWTASQLRLFRRHARNMMEKLNYSV